MDDLRQVRIQVTFRIDPTAAPGGRMNLVEGFVSFALFVDGGGGIHFSIVDANGAWTLCSSPGAAVSHDTWHTVVAAHDGVTESRIALDGAVVASNTVVRGPVRSVGAMGIAIGRWPDQPQYLFRGHIAEVALYRFDPKPELAVLLGAECVDPERLQGAINAIQKRTGGLKLEEWATQVNAALEEAAALMLQDGGSTRVRELLAQTTLAFGARDPVRFRQLVTALSKHARTSIPPGSLRGIQQRLARQGDALGLTDQEVQQVAAALCMTEMGLHKKGRRNVR